MKKFNFELKDLVVPLVSVLVVILCLFLVLFPRVEKVMEMRGQIKTQKAKITATTQKLNDLSSLSEADLYDSSSLLLQALPKDKDFLQFLLALKKLLQENDVLLESYKFSPGLISTESASAKSGEKDNQISITISFSSTFTNFSNFVTKLEKIVPLSSMGNIKIKSQGSTTSGELSLLKGDLTVVGYFSPLPKTIGSYDKALVKISSQDQKIIEELRNYSRFYLEAPSFEQVIVGKEDPFSF